MEDIGDEEILSRAYDLASEYTTKAPALAKQMEEFGRLRAELLLLAAEIKKRGLSFNAPTD